MLRTTTYALSRVPLKKSHKIGINSQIDVQLPKSDAKILERLRSACLGILERYRKQEDSVSGLDSFLSTEGDRERYVIGMITAVETYAAKLIEAVTSCPKFGIAQYYVWGSSLAEKQDIAYDDYRYELACVYYNAACILMGLAHYELCIKSSVGTMTALEKESYRTLLKAAGYFGVCQTLVADIRKQTMGVAQVPVPTDMALSILFVLEQVCLAQAQEIGMNRAVEADPKGEKETAAKLCHRIYILFQGAKDRAQRVSSKNKDFGDLLSLVSVKCDVYRALSYSYAASYELPKSPSNALALMEKANQHAQTVAGYQSGKSKLPCSGEKVVESCLTTIRRSSERITQINSLVHRAKPTIGTVSLPTPLVLAQRPEVNLPVALPPASASVAPQPEVLSGEERWPKATH